MKQRAPEAGRSGAEPRLSGDIEMPRNSPTGFVCAFFATFMGFALIWHIWWMVAAGVVGAFATFVVFAWRDQDEYVIPADEVARIDRANRRTRAPSLGCRAMSACHDRTRRCDRLRGSDAGSHGARRARGHAAVRRRSASSSATASGSSCSATS